MRSDPEEQQESVRILEVFGEPIVSGGQEAFAINVVRHYNEPATVIDFYTPYYCGNEYYRKTVEEHGGRVYEEGIPFTPGKARENIYQPLLDHLKRNLYDTVHVHSGSLSVLALVAKAAHACQIPRIVVHSHSPAEKESLHHLAAKLRYHHALSFYPTDYLACSPAAARWKYPKRIAEKKAVIIQNGIDLEKYAPDEEVRKQMRAQLQIGDATFVIGQVGRFSHEKNHRFSIELLESMVRKGENCKLLLLGDGELREEIERQVREKGLEKHVIFTGNVNQVEKYLQAMDVMILPSLYEGLPLTGVEAQAAGLSLIVSTGVSPETNITGDVKYIPLDNIDFWCCEILKAKRYPRVNRTAQMREKGYDIRKTVETLIGIYHGNATNQT